MKECPLCHKGYGDHLNHCLTDGTKLKFRSSTVAEEPAPGLEGEHPDSLDAANTSDFGVEKTPTSFLDDFGNDDYGNDEKTPVVMIEELLHQQQSREGVSRELMNYLESAAGVKEAEPSAKTSAAQESAVEAPAVEEPAVEEPAVVAPEAVALEVVAPEVEELEVEELDMEEVEVPAPAAPPPPPSEHAAGVSASSGDSYTGQSPVASGEIEVSSVLPVRSLRPSSSAADTVEIALPPDLSSSHVDEGTLSAQADARPPLLGDEALDHEALLPPSAIRRRWILMGAGLVVVTGMVALYFFSTSSNSSTESAPITRSAPASPAPVASDLSVPAPAASAVASKAPVPSKSARALDAGASTPDATILAKPASAEEEISRPVAETRREEQKKQPAKARGARRRYRPSRRKGTTRPPKKKLYRKTIDPFSE